MTYETDISIGSCKNSSRCTAKSVPGLFLADARPTSQIVKKAANNKVQRHSQAQMSYPAQRPVPYGAEFRPWRCRIIANVFAKPQNVKFEGLASFFRCFNHFCKSSVKNQPILVRGRSQWYLLGTSYQCRACVCFQQSLCLFRQSVIC